MEQLNLINTIKNKIEYLKEELNDSIETNGRTSEKTLRKSQELDIYINKYLKLKLNI